jgi:hypothetical protein
MGRANRFGTWRDLLRFQSEGVELYDMGGWYEGKSDIQKLQINEFKRGFGGHLLQEFHCVRAATVKGALALWAISMRDRLKAASANYELMPRFSRRARLN